MKTVALSGLEDERLVGTWLAVNCAGPSLQHRPEMAHAFLVAEPLVARFHFVTRFTSRLQAVLVRLLRRYFVRAPGWILLTTRGRRTGLPREVLLPCERFQDGILVISTYDRRSIGCGTSNEIQQCRLPVPAGYSLPTPKSSTTSRPNVPW